VSVSTSQESVSTLPPGEEQLSLPPLEVIDANNDKLVMLDEFVGWYEVNAISMESPASVSQLTVKWGELSEHFCTGQVCDEHGWQRVRALDPCLSGPCLRAEGILDEEEAQQEVPVFDDVDLNKDGVVTKAEFLQWYFHGELVNPTKEEQIGAQFEATAQKMCSGNVCDANGWTVVQTQVTLGTLVAAQQVITQVTDMPTGSTNGEVPTGGAETGETGVAIEGVISATVAQKPKSWLFLAFLLSKVMTM
jgi:hypothetical protein